MDPSSAVPGRALALLRLREVVKKTGKCRSDIYRDVALGRFPAPVKLSQKASAWVEHEVDEWIAKRIAARERAA